MSSATDALHPGDIVSDYRVDKRIGKGAYGTVYAAVHPLIGKRVAIKVLDPAFSKSLEMVSRFVAEARLVNKIQHRNIIDIFAFGQLDGGAHYFIMELLKGAPLDEYLAEHKPLEPATAMVILRGVARALAAAHKVGIAHRDLKPANVYLSFDEDGGIYPKLLDFGIAKLLGDESAQHHTRIGTAMGTPLYMSPEQCRGGDIDQRTDIYAFGIMAHEAFAGRRPFAGGSATDAIMQQLGEIPPPVSEHRAGLPPKLDSAILAMLEKSPDNRPATIRQAFQLLEDAFGQQAQRFSLNGGEALPSQPTAAPAAHQSQVAALDTAAFLAGQGASASQLASHSIAPPSAAAPAGAAPQAASQSLGAAASQSLGAAASQSLGAAASQSLGARASQSLGARASQSVSAAARPARTVAMEGSPMIGAAGSLRPSQPQAYQPALAPQALAAAAAPGATSAGASITGMDAAIAQPIPARRKRSSGLLLAALLALVAVIALPLYWLQRQGPDESSAVPAAEAEPLTTVAAVTSFEVPAAMPLQGSSFRVERTHTLKATLRPESMDPGAGGAESNGIAAGDPTTDDAVKRLQADGQRRMAVEVVASAVEEIEKLKITYHRHETTIEHGPGTDEREVEPTVGRSFLVKWKSASEHELAVSLFPAGHTTADQQDLVLFDADGFVSARPEFLDHPIHIGEEIQLDGDTMERLFALEVGEDGQTETFSGNMIVLRAVEQQGEDRIGVFDVRSHYLADGNADGVDHIHLESPLTGNIHLNLASGWVTAMDISGPLTGSATVGPETLKISGKLSAAAVVQR